MPEQPEQGRPREPSLGVLLSPCIVTVELPAHQPNDDADGTEDFQLLRRLLDPRVPLLEEGQLYHWKGHNFFLPLHIYIYIYISIYDNVYICLDRPCVHAIHASPPLFKEAHGGQTHEEKGNNFFSYTHIYVYIFIIIYMYVCICNIFCLYPVLQVRILYIPRKMRRPPHS